MALHELALELLLDIAPRLLGASFSPRTVTPQLVHVCTAVIKPVGTFSATGMLDGAMQKKIGVASNGRGEMRIVFQRQSKMSLVVGLIHRQTQAAQQLGVDQGLVRAPNGIALNGSKLSGFWVLPPAHFQTAAAQKLLKGLQLVGRRRLVHTKQHGQLLPANKPGRFNVGGNHQLFNQPVLIAPALQVNIDNLPFSSNLNSACCESKSSAPRRSRSRRRMR